MGISLAIIAFFQALKRPEDARQFVENQPKEAQSQESPDLSHLRLLALLQQSSRFIDFIKEDLSSLDDAQIGAAVRKIHSDCDKCLEEIVTLRPVLDEHEGAKVQVARGYDPAKIKVVGKVRGDPPFSGILVHKGWKAHKRSLPKKVGEQTSEVICAAEVEVS